jgi:hypothetical protein
MMEEWDLHLFHFDALPFGGQVYGQSPFGRERAWRELDYLTTRHPHF